MRRGHVYDYWDGLECVLMDRVQSLVVISQTVQLMAVKIYVCNQHGSLRQSTTDDQ